MNIPFFTHSRREILVRSKINEMQFTIRKERGIINYATIYLYFFHLYIPEL